MGPLRVFAKLFFPRLLRWHGKIEVWEHRYQGGVVKYTITEYGHRYNPPGKNEWATKTEAEAVADELFKRMRISERRVS